MTEDEFFGRPIAANEAAKQDQQRMNEEFRKGLGDAALSLDENPGEPWKQGDTLATPVDGSIHDRLMTMDVPRCADELHSAIIDARSHPLIPIIEEYMRELAGVAYEAGVMQAGFESAFATIVEAQGISDILAGKMSVSANGDIKALSVDAPVMPEIADRDCSFIERDGDAK